MDLGRRLGCLNSKQEKASNLRNDFKFKLIITMAIIKINAVIMVTIALNFVIEIVAITVV